MIVDQRIERKINQKYKESYKETEDIDLFLDIVKVIARNENDTTCIYKHT